MWEGFKTRFGNKKEPHMTQIQADRIPYHIAIIMDGNGRWAKKRSLPRVAGHRAGMKALKEVTTAADELGVKILTMYAFSTENWKRPSSEVDFLMRLPQEFLSIELENLHKKHVKVQILGDQGPLPKSTKDSLSHACEYTRNNTGLVLNIALNYGSRIEIVEAVRKIVEEAKSGRIAVEDINVSMIHDHLLTAGLPDPDLLIRTSGEVRLSNFLLWQSAYTELWFTDVFWPDFGKEDFYQAILDYQNRGRRFGGLQ